MAPTALCAAIRTSATTCSVNSLGKELSSEATSSSGPSTPRHHASTVTYSPGVPVQRQMAPRTVPTAGHHSPVFMIFSCLEGSLTQTKKALDHKSLDYADYLVTLGAELREEGIRLKVLEQRIDTDTAEGRAMFGMLSVLAEFQRELIVANTRDGLAGAPSSPPPRSAKLSGSTTRANTPSNRSPPCSASNAPPSAATSTKSPSAPGPAPPRTPARPARWSPRQPQPPR